MSDEDGNVEKLLAVCARLAASSATTTYVVSCDGYLYVGMVW